MSKQIAVLFLCLLLAVNAGHATETAAQEVQVLIDVSGSMKQNDPQNLRSDATQLLIHLLPDGTRVSLWTFAEKTESLSSSDAINETWRQKALKASRAIHSRGLYTDLETAIRTAMEQGFNVSDNKSLLVLTDGMIDVSPDIMVSADSRERILSEWIPKLRERNIQVQTIALSDQADKELLEQLAFETGGWHETASTADQLERLFLKTAQKAAPRDTLPLQNNHFQVDSRVQEFSVLVFKPKDGASTQLITPDQKTIGRSNAGQDVAWNESAHYDLITVKHPQAGEWAIDAATDPDNQVMVLTDLQLKIQDIPNFASEKQALALKLFFTEQNQPITRADFLDLISLSLSIDEQAPVPLTAIASEPGYFGTTLTDLKPGKHNLNFVADGKTFKRELNKSLEVTAAPISVEKRVDREKRQVTLKFTPDTAVLDNSALAINAKLYQSGKPQENRTASLDNGEWLMPLDALAPGETLLVNFNIMAKTLTGSAITPSLAPITVDDNDFASVETASPTPPEEPATPEPETAEPDTPEPAEAEQATEETNWIQTIAIVVGINVLLCGLGYFGYRALKKANAKKQQQLLERLT